MFFPKKIKTKPGQCRPSCLRFLILHRPALRLRPLYSPRPRPHSSHPLQPPRVPSAHQLFQKKIYVEEDIPEIRKLVALDSGPREDLLIFLSFHTLVIYHVFTSRSNKCTSKIYTKTDK